MRIAEAETAFRAFLATHGKAPETLQPDEMLRLGIAFYAAERVTDAAPEDGDMLLFQWGVREALPPHYGACFYVDLTRQFIAAEGEDDDAMFQLTCQLQYEPTAALRQVGTGDRWCDSPAALPAFQAFATAHPALAAVRACVPVAVEYYLTPV